MLTPSPKRFAFCILLFILVSLSLSAQSNRHALLVAVGDYPDSTGWPKLYATGDAPLIKNTLLTQGFPESNIRTLLDSEATKQGILDAIHAHLTGRVQPGDIAVFHFSGHGQQVWDDDSDEIDGLDESIVPFDSPRQYKMDGYKGENLLRDEELGAALQEVRRKLGTKGSLLVLIDACHSGTGTRGRITARGTDVIMADPAFLEKLEGLPPDNNALASEGTAEEDGLASMVALFSSSPNQMSYEYRDESEKHFGLFSYAFSKAISGLSSETTYRALLDEIKLEISSFTHRQTPQAEGQLDHLVFGEGLRTVSRYFQVKESITPDLLLINAGELQGLSTGSLVVLYPAGTTDTAGTAPLATGIVDEAAPFDADVLLDQPLDKQAAMRARVFLRERSFGDLDVSLEVALTDKRLQSRLETRIADYPFIRLVDEQSDLYLENALGLAGQTRLVLYQHDDTPIWNRDVPPEEDTDKLAYELARRAMQYARANYLRRLELDHSSLRAEVRVIVVKTPDESVSLDGRPLQVGETVRIQITNTGEKGCYFSLLDIQPDHQVTKVFPYDLPAVDYYLVPGDTFVAPFDHDIDRPTGTEVLKIIATKEPLELGFTRSGGSVKNPLEVLLSGLLLPGEETRSETPALPGQLGYVGSLVVEIVE